MDTSNFRLPPEQWAQLRRLLGQALDLPAAARAAWLDALPPEHAPLAARLRALLDHADASLGPAGNAMGAMHTLPKVETRDFAPRAEDTERVGELIGPYRLVRPLGEGGMASVWLAERSDLEGRRVALKLPHGAWRRAGLVERFARERAILAALEHPHIARLYDAGLTPAGQPFLALEYVDGERIDRWCDTHALGVPARLTLFLQVCDAVAHAHARLVVHRDIKPSNVLVDAQGQVRLLDFGIAKLLEGDTAIETALTREAGRALTPEYAAPEQIRGEPVGTATDTYAMGVLLYELLAGRHPYAQANTPAGARAQVALAADPARPSDAAFDAERKRALRGDLDTILLKALKKRPDERYASADALAADLRRHLAHQPVLARPDSVGYRLRKLARRHRVVFAAGAAVGLALLAGATVALWQAREAKLQRDGALQAQARAEREKAAAKRAEAVAIAQTELSQFLLMEMASNSEELEAQLARARRLFDAQYRNDPGLRGRLLLDLGGLFNGRGDRARANALWAEAEPLLRDHGEWTALAELQCLLARESARNGQVDQARARLSDATAGLDRSGEPADTPVRRDCLSSAAIVERLAGNTTYAVGLLERAVAMEQATGRAEQGTFVELLNTLARTYYDDGRYRDAVPAARRAGTLTAKLALDQTSHASTARALEAIALREGGQPLAALALLEPARTTGRVSERSQYAETMLQLGRLDGLMQYLEELVVAGRPLGSPATREAYLLKVQLLADLGRWREASAPLAEADALFAPLGTRRSARRVLPVRAHWALAAGDLALAQKSLDDVRAAVTGEGPSEDPVWHLVHQLQARVHLANGRGDDALKSADAALERGLRGAVDPDASVHVAMDQLLRAQALRLLGNVDAARADAALAERHARAAGGEEHPLVKQARAEAVR